MEGNVRKVSEAVAAVADEAELDQCLLEQYDKQLNGFKLEPYNILRSILSIEGNVYELLDQEAQMSKVIFDVHVCLKIRRLLHMSVPVAHMEGIKHPKINEPSFERDMLNWQTLWEKYEVSIHSRTQLTDAEKLAYSCSQ